MPTGSEPRRPHRTGRAPGPVNSGHTRAAGLGGCCAKNLYLPDDVYSCALLEGHLGPCSATDVVSLQLRLDQAVVFLREHEWAYLRGQIGCWACKRIYGGTRTDFTHEPDCPLAAFLAEAGKETT